MPAHSLATSIIQTPPPYFTVLQAHAFVASITHLIPLLLGDSNVHSLTPSIIHIPPLPCTQTCLHSLTRSIIHSPPPSCTQTIAHSLPSSFTLLWIAEEDLLDKMGAPTSEGAPTSSSSSVRRSALGVRRCCRALSVAYKTNCTTTTTITTAAFHSANVTMEFTCNAFPPPRPPYPLSAKMNARTGKRFAYGWWN